MSINDHLTSKSLKSAKLEKTNHIKGFMPSIINKNMSDALKKGKRSSSSIVKYMVNRENEVTSYSPKNPQ